MQCLLFLVCVFCVDGHSSNISVVRHFPGDSVGSAGWILM